MFPGLGGQPSDEHEEPGDLLIEVSVQPHKDFTREGDDLIYKIRLTVPEMILGKVVTVPHFDGPMELDLRDAGILNPTKDVLMEGKGMPRPDSSGRKGGALVLRLEIVYPSSKIVWRDDQRAALQKVFGEVGLA